MLVCDIFVSCKMIILWIYYFQNKIRRRHIQKCDRNIINQNRIHLPLHIDVPVTVINLAVKQRCWNNISAVVGTSVWRGKWIQLFFVDDISITFLYVSSSDLVLKNNNTKDYHFAIHKQYHKQTRMQKLFDMPPTCESMKMTHTKIRSFQIRHIMCSAIVPTGYNCSEVLFLCFYLSGIQSPRDISAASIFVPLLWSSRSPTLYLMGQGFWG